MSNEQFLIDLVTKTIDEVNKVVTYASSQYAKDYEVATERVHEAKLERIGNLVLPLKFYLESFKGGESCNDGK